MDYDMNSNEFSPTSNKNKILNIWYKYKKYIILLVCGLVIIIGLLVILSFPRSSKLSEYSNIERIMILNAQDYVQNNNIKGNVYVSLNNLNVKIDENLKCNMLSGIYKEDDSYIPYLICNNYVSQSIKDVIAENNTVKEYGELNGDTLYFVLNDKYKEAGVRTDYQVNVKGDDIDNGLNIVTYYINDKGRNLGELKRIVIAEEVEGSYPVLTLIGEKTKSIPLGSKYTEPGYKATDESDGNITDRVVVTGSVNTSKTGTYKLTYSVTNTKNRITKLERIVIVNDQDIKLNVTHTIDKQLTGQKNATIKITVNGEGYKYTLLPDNSKKETKEITYTVYKNGTYDFLIYDQNDNGEVYSVNVTGLDPNKLILVYNGNGQTSFYSKSDSFSLDTNGNVLNNGKMYKVTTSSNKSVDLEDYNGSNFIFIKARHHAEKGKEWYVENASGKKTYYSQGDTTLKAESLANASGCDLMKDDCTVTVKINWQKGYDNSIPITKRFLIGDSRTTGMFRYINKDSGVTLDALAAGTVTIGMDTWSCKSGMGYDWMVSTGIPNIESKLDYNSALIILMGVNDSKNINNYINYFEEKLLGWEAKGIRVYFVSVNPCNGKNEAANHAINAFNEKIKTVEGLRYIDTNTYLKQTGFVSNDGLHYVGGTHTKIYNYIMEHLQ